MKPKLKQCKVCKVDFMPRSSTQRVCNMQCAVKDIKSKNQRKSETTRRKAEAQQRREHRERKEAAKTKSEVAKEAQKAFNQYIRERDLGNPCISCGVMYGQFHAGHYRTTAAASHLRYNTYNVHRQCAQCNSSKSGAILSYRQGLILKIGEDKVEALENDNRIVKYDIEYLRRVKRIFAKRARQVRRRRDSFA